MESELENIGEDRQALRWAFGCIGASYKERLSLLRPVLAAIFAALAIGLAFALTDEALTGVLAARPFPYWYAAFARTHEHLSLELWFSLGALPAAAVAACFGGLLAALARSSSAALPFVALGVWFAYGLLPLPGTRDCVNPISGLLLALRLWPVSTSIGFVLPAFALVLGYRRFRNG